MKTFFTVLTGMFLINAGYSQPVISNIEPAIGDQFFYTQQQEVFFYTFDQTGADYYWEYPELYSQTVVELNCSIINPSEGTENEAFPGAASVWQEDYVNWSDNFQNYLSFENSMMTILGRVQLDIPNSKYYNNPEVSLTFPLTYQSNGSDEFDGHYMSGWGPSYRYFYGSTSYVVDGYGTVETQHGVFENVLRITTTSIEIMPDSGSGTQNVLNTSRISWYSPEYPVPVLMVTSSVEADIWGDIDSTLLISTLATYNGTATRIEEQTARNTFEIYPNPATNQISISSDFQGAAELRIYSVDGKMVLQKWVQNDDYIDLNNIQPGYYMSRLIVNNQPFASRAFVIIQ